MTGDVQSPEIEHDAPVRSRVTRDSLWLVSGYAATAGSGFVFWLLAAVWIPQSQLGVDASVLAIIMAAAALASNGPGSALIVMLPLGGPAAREVLRRALLSTAALALLFGAVGGVVVAIFLPTHLTALQAIGTVTIAAIVWAMFNLQTQALAGASDAKGTLIVNGTANLLKLALLGVLATGTTVPPLLLVIATIAPAAAMAALSLSLFVPRALRRDDQLTGSSRAWDADLSRTFVRFAIQNAVAIGLVLCAGLSISFLVTTLSTPAEGAIFAIAFQFSVALDLIGVAVATALARSAVGAFAPAAELARGYAIKVSLAVAALGVGATVLTPVMFLLLGRGYPPLYGMAVVGILATASAVRPGYDIWSALSRARHRVRPVLAGNAIWVLVLFGLVALLVPHWGALGASVAAAGAAVVLAAIGTIGIRHARPLVPLPPKGVPA